MSKHSVKGQEQAVKGQDSPAECLKIDKVKDALGEVKLLVPDHIEQLDMLVPRHQYPAMIT